MEYLEILASNRTIIDLQGNSKGTNYIPPCDVDVCHTDINMPCDDLQDDLVLSPTLEDSVVALQISCDKIIEMLPTLSAPIAEVNSSIDMSAPNELIVAETGQCDLMIDYDLDHIKLVRNNEELAAISNDNSLFSIVLDSHMSLSHAENKIVELTCLKRVYAPDFTFNLVGDYGVDNEFFVHRICITCDELDNVRDYKSGNMLSHFDMTSNFGINYGPNTLLQNCLFQHDVAQNFETLNFELPILGWFNDEYNTLEDAILCFTYICKLSCNTFMWFVSCDNSLALYFTRHANYPRQNVAYAQLLRGVKTDDIYIYHVYTLSLLLTMFQEKRRRGRLYFQERGNDMDMSSLDTTNTITTSSTFDQENDEMASRTTSIQEGEDDEDIPAIDTTTATLQGPLTRAPARQLNYQVLSFLGTLPNIIENMMLPKSDVFMLLRNDGPSKDEKDTHWSMIVHGEEGKLVRMCC